MSEAAAFAESLARVLGPLYRVSLLDDRGEVVSLHGTIKGGRPVGDPLPLPGGNHRIQLEIDRRTIEVADRVLHDLAAGSEPMEEPLDVFSNLEDALDHLIAQAEARIGRKLSDMTRSDKQELVHFLDERGAFALRKSVERVAELLNVSRFTIYNYLDATRTR